MTDSRSTAVVKEVLTGGDEPKPSATAIVKMVLTGGDEPKPMATSIVKMVWANVAGDDCCCAFDMMGGM